MPKLHTEISLLHVFSLLSRFFAAIFVLRQLGNFCFRSFSFTEQWHLLGEEKNNSTVQYSTDFKFAQAPEPSYLLHNMCLM